MQVVKNRLVIKALAANDTLKDVDTSALNGVRGLDARTLDKWAGDEHRERIRSLLREMPELPDRLIEMGYEANANWMLRYR